ncbi:MAG: hypothetical protein KDC98_18800 [Planctomycetes bacterium]|nr:hypothetical protein [Planctomycetota bacterium]
MTDFSEHRPFVEAALQVQSAGNKFLAWNEALRSWLGDVKTQGVAIAIDRVHGALCGLYPTLRQALTVSEMAPFRDLGTACEEVRRHHEDAGELGRLELLATVGEGLVKCSEIVEELHVRSLSTATDKPSSADDLMTIAEAAAQAGLTTDVVRGWVKRRRQPIPNESLGGIAHVRLGDVIKERDLKQRKSPKTPPCAAIHDQH